MRFLFKSFFFLSASTLVLACAPIEDGYDYGGGDGKGDNAAAGITIRKEDFMRSLSGAEVQKLLEKLPWGNTTSWLANTTEVKVDNKSYAEALSHELAAMNINPIALLALGQVQTARGVSMTWDEFIRRNNTIHGILRDFYDCRPNGSTNPLSEIQCAGARLKSLLDAQGSGADAADNVIRSMYESPTAYFRTWTDLVTQARELGIMAEVGSTQSTTTSTNSSNTNQNCTPNSTTTTAPSTADFDRTTRTEVRIEDVFGSTYGVATDNGPIELGNLIAVEFDVQTEWADGAQPSDEDGRALAGAVYAKGRADNGTETVIATAISPLGTRSPLTSAGTVMHDLVLEPTVFVRADYSKADPPDIKLTIRLRCFDEDDERIACDDSRDLLAGGPIDEP